MKSIILQNSIPQITFVLSKVFLSTALVAELIGVSLTNTAIASSELHRFAAPVSFPKSRVLIATAYTDITLPTLRRGDRGKSVKILQKILLDNGF